VVLLFLNFYIVIKNEMDEKEIVKFKILPSIFYNFIKNDNIDFICKISYMSNFFPILENKEVKSISNKILINITKDLIIITFNYDSKRRGKIYYYLNNFSCRIFGFNQKDLKYLKNNLEEIFDMIKIPSSILSLYQNDLEEIKYKRKTLDLFKKIG